MTKSQYETLSEELNKVLLLISKGEIERVLPLIELFLIESNVFGHYEEIDEPNQRHPVEILKNQLFPLEDKRELSKWNAILSLYLAKEIEKRNQQNNLKLVNYALHAINVSNAYHSDAIKQSKQLKKDIKKGRSKEGTESNKKRYEPLEIMKNAAFDGYEPAIDELRRQRTREKKKTRDNRVTYNNIAKIILPQIVHLNKDKSGQKLIGRNDDPVASLARILEEAARKGKIKTTRGR